MHLDNERSGHFKDNLLSLTFCDSDIDISFNLDSEQANELKNFLDEILQ